MSIALIPQTDKVVSSAFIEISPYFITLHIILKIIKNKGLITQPLYCSMWLLENDHINWGKQTSWYVHKIAYRPVVSISFTKFFFFLASLERLAQNMKYPRDKFISCQTRPSINVFRFVSCFSLSELFLHLCETYHWDQEPIKVSLAPSRQACYFHSTKWSSVKLQVY